MVIVDILDIDIKRLEKEIASFEERGISEISAGINKMSLYKDNSYIGFYRETGLNKKTGFSKFKIRYNIKINTLFK